MRKVELRMNEQFKYETIKRVVAKSITVDNAAVKLNCTTKTIYNLIKLYNTQGKEGFVHGNRGKSPAVKIDGSIKERIIQLYQDKYQPANFKHFQELLRRFEDINISYPALYYILTNAGFLSPKCNKVTRKKKAQELKQKLDSKITLTPVEKDYVVSTHLMDPEYAHPRKSRAKYFGELIQMDASEHVWFGNSKVHLHLAIDDATGQVIGAYFDIQETLAGYYNVLYQILTKYGIPAKFLTDNRTIFNYNKLKNPSDEKDTHTQFGYACHQLGIDLITSSTPQVKGRVERVFQTLQSRLITELRLAGINTIWEANEFLNSFFQDFNETFAYHDNYTKSVFDNQITLEKINYTLAVVCTRKVDKGNSIKYKNKYYQFYDGNNLMLIKPKTTCCVLEAFDGSLVASVDEVIYELHELERNKTVSKDFDIEQPKKPAYKSHKPKDCHPWTYYSYKNKRRRNTA